MLPIWPWLELHHLHLNSEVAALITNQTALDSKYTTGQLTLRGYANLFDEVVSAGTTIENPGTVDGAEVAQLYISFPVEAEQPARVLRGFEKSIHLGWREKLT